MLLPEELVKLLGTIVFVKQDDEWTRGAVCKIEQGLGIKFFMRHVKEEEELGTVECPIRPLLGPFELEDLHAAIPV